MNAFKVSTNFDSPSCLAMTASKPVAGDSRLPNSTELKPTTLTWGSLLRRSDAVSTLSETGARK